MAMTQSALDKRLARVSAWLAGSSTRRSWLARLGAVLFGAHAMQGASAAFGAVDLCGSVPVGCVQGDGDGWVSRPEGCKDTATGLVWSHQRYCERGGLIRTIAFNDCNSIGMSLPTRSQVKTALQHNFVAHNDNRNGQGQGMNGSNWTIDTNPQGTKGYTYVPADGPKQKFSLCTFANCSIHAFCVKQE